MTIRSASIVAAAMSCVLIAAHAAPKPGTDRAEGDGSEVADNAAFEKELAKGPVKAVVDKSTVVRLGFELPNSVVIGKRGEPGVTSDRVVAKGVLAQCAIGEPKRFELAASGVLALGSEGFLFDSNYARGRTNEVVFSGGTIGSFEPSFIRTAAPIKLTGTVRASAKYNLIVRASFEGPGNIVKSKGGILAMQYPCKKATGRLVIEEGMLALGPAASWGGTVVLKRGTTLKCPSVKAIGRLVKDPGAKVEEVGAGSRGDLSAEAFPQPATAYKMRQIQREKLGRGVYAWRANENEVHVSWRYKSSDPFDIAFNVYKNGRRLNAAPIKDVTYYVDKSQWTGLKPMTYEVRGVKADGREIAYKTSASWRLPQNAPVGYFDIELDPPKSGRTPEGKDYSYQPYDCSVGDLDGDGELDLVVIWWPTLAYDNSQWGQSGETWIEGVKLDGTNRSLWKICLGPNIRSGSHYVPVMVADFDGDGSSEVICRTADGTTDGKGRVLNRGEFAPGNKFKDWRSEDCHVVFAPNYVTCFSGRTGEALDTLPFKPSVHEDPKVIDRKDHNAVKKYWRARNPGNQAFRFLSAIGYLDGIHPSVMMCRGYYSRTYVTAYDWDGKNLKERWFFDSEIESNWGYGGQGFHNLRVGDVDFDGRDELIYGHMVVDHDGQGLWTTGYGHGDAMHLIQASPVTRGLQVWTCHEASPFGVSLIDAQSGRTLLRRTGPIDTGSCNALDVDPAAPGVELFSGAHCGIFSAKTLEEHMRPKPKPEDNYYGMLRFGIWWKGDMTRSAYSGGSLVKHYSIKDRCVTYIFDAGREVESNHGTKGCPCLIADIFGDWREELLLRRKDNRAIRLFMTPEDTKYRFHTFLEDPVYRISVATQNNGYNIPTDPGFYFGPDLLGRKAFFRGTQLP